MGSWEPLTWQPPVRDGVPASRRRRGRYWAYVPDPLRTTTPLDLPADVVDRVSEASAALAAVPRLAGERGPVDLDALTSLTLRSEAVASSVIEGVQVSARNVALADLTGHGSSAALEVARAGAVLRSATRDLAAADRVGVDDVVALQSLLVPYLPGLRAEQVWIGGVSPLVAAFVPPAHERVPALMEDLVAYLDDPADTPVVAAAVVHAQFETIHPFRDGNGRVGRALVHTVLARAGVVSTVVPFSRVFAARTQRYLDGLVAWRTEDGYDERAQWVEVFADALVEGASLAGRMVRRLDALRAGHRERLLAARDAAGGRAPRRGSTVLRLLDDVVAHPVDTAAGAAGRLGVSAVAAREALEELAACGVYRTVKVDKGKTVSYVAADVLAVADTALDGGPPPEDGPEPPGVRAVPTRTQRARRPGLCGYPMPRAGGWCALPPEHGGKHRSVVPRRGASRAPDADEPPT